MSDITTFQWVSISLGSIGTILGISNLIRSMRADSFKLKVIPSIYAKTQDGQSISTSLDKLPKDSKSELPLDEMFRIGKICVSITNLSKFPVYLSQVGFVSSSSVDRQIFSGITSKNGFPIKIEPRQSITAYCEDKTVVNTEHKGTIKLFVKTECGREIKATSPALKRWVEQVGAPNPLPPATRRVV